MEIDARKVVRPRLDLLCLCGTQNFNVAIFNRFSDLFLELVCQAGFLLLREQSN